MSQQPIIVFDVNETLLDLDARPREVIAQLVNGTPGAVRALGKLGFTIEPLQ